tara:strand:- start:14143 stop:15432 length:1290 start_codon:yes stop_codon:yes gene_type:complete
MLTRYQGIIKSFFVLALFVGIGKFLGLFKEIFFAKNYGVSIDVDFYFFFLSLFGWPAAIVLTVFSAIFIPVIANLERGERKLFVAELTGITFIFSVLLFIIAFIFGNFFIDLFPYKSQLDDISVSYGSLIFMVPIFLLISLFSILIMSTGDKINTLFEAIPALILLIYFIFIPTKDLNALICMTIFAFIFQIGSLLLFWKFKNKAITIKFSFSSAAWSDAIRNFTIILISTILLSTVTLIDQFFSVNLSAESVSILNYANKLIIVIFALGGLVIQRTFLPDFSIMHRNNDLTIKDAFYWFIAIFLLSVLLIYFLSEFAEVILGLLFVRGDFSEQNLKSIVPVFQFGLIQIPFYFSSLVLVQYYLVKKYIYVVALSGIIAFLIKIPLNIVLLENFGLKGINLATSAMYFISFLILTLYIIRAQRVEYASN